LTCGDAEMRIRDEAITPEIPDDCPKVLEKIMKMCWHVVPRERALFKEICKMFSSSSSEDS